MNKAVSSCLFRTLRQRIFPLFQRNYCNKGNGIRHCNILMLIICIVCTFYHYVSFSLCLPNLLSFLLSDHGNSRCKMQKLFSENTFQRILLSSRDSLFTSPATRNILPQLRAEWKKKPNHIVEDHLLQSCVQILSALKQNIKHCEIFACNKSVLDCVCLSVRLLKAGVCVCAWCVKMNATGHQIIYLRRKERKSKEKGRTYATMNGWKSITNGFVKKGEVRSWIFEKINTLKYTNTYGRHGYICDVTRAFRWGRSSLTEPLLH